MIRYHLGLLPLVLTIALLAACIVPAAQTPAPSTPKVPASSTLVEPTPTGQSAESTAAAQVEQQVSPD